MDTGVSSSHVTSSSCKPAEGISSLQQGLALLQSAANAGGKVGTLKDFPRRRCEQRNPNLEPISSLLSKMYFPTDLDKISGSDRVSHPMLMWDLVKYSLLSMEIASRSGGKYAAPSYSLNALYKELESSSRFILSLLLKLVQNTCKNSLHVLQRFIATKSFADSTCFGISIVHGSKTSGQGTSCSLCGFSYSYQLVPSIMCFCENLCELISCSLIHLPCTIPNQKYRVSIFCRL